MSRPSHDIYFLQMLRLVAARSTCFRRAVGAIIVSENNTILATGYNGVPRGFNHCGVRGREGLAVLQTPCLGAQDPSGDNTRCFAVHAEQNALLQCSRLDLARTLYTSCEPCFICAKLIANTPITRIVVAEPYPDPLGRQVLQSAKILVELIPNVT